MTLRHDDGNGARFGTQPEPGTPAWDGQFGRGWTILVLVSMGVLVAGFVGLVAAETPAARVRRGAVLIALFAASFAVAVGYHLVRGIGIPFGFYRGERLIQQRVLHPATHPIGFRAFIAAVWGLALTAIIGAGWIYTRAGPVAEYLQAHSERR